MFEIRKKVERPAQSKPPSAGSKYPLGVMEVDDFFRVPKSEMQEGDTDSKFRNRIHQSVRNFALRENKGVEEDAKKIFRVELMREDQPADKRPAGDDPDYLMGDVGVWRDK